MFKEHQQIVLTEQAVGDEGEELKPGDVGSIVHIHPGEKAFVVEFMSLDGGTVALATVLASQARSVTRSDLTLSADIIGVTHIAGALGGIQTHTLPLARELLCSLRYEGVNYKYLRTTPRMQAIKNGMTR